MKCRFLASLGMTDSPALVSSRAQRGICFSPGNLPHDFFFRQSVLLAGAEVAQGKLFLRHLVLTDEDGVAGAQAVGALERLAELHLFVQQLHGSAGVAQALRQGAGGGASRPEPNDEAV